MQRGCLKRNSRKRGPDVWQFRWSEPGSDGKRLYHKKIVLDNMECSSSGRARGVFLWRILSL